MVSRDEAPSEAERYSLGQYTYEICRDVGVGLYKRLSRDDESSSVYDELEEVDGYLEEIWDDL